MILMRLFAQIFNQQGVMAAYGKLYTAVSQFRERLIKGYAAQGAIDGKGQCRFSVNGMACKDYAVRNRF